MVLIYRGESRDVITPNNFQNVYKMSVKCETRDEIFFNFSEWTLVLKFAMNLEFPTSIPIFRAGLSLD